MPYTLAMGFVWVLLAVLLGMVLGWLLRSVAAKRQVERARSANLGIADQQELERLRNRVADLEPEIAERDRLRADVEENQRSQEPSDGSTRTSDGVEGRSPVSDLAKQAAAVLGKSVTIDDLTLIDGIGAQVAELCHGIGIRTWAELSETEVSLLGTMLADAGQRFKTLDPSSWPAQAELLAAGSWAEFVVFTEELDGGRPVG